MHFDEALQIAQAIRERYPRLDVIAIGRFVSPEEIDTVPEKWGVSVRVDRSDRRRVIWSSDELTEFGDVVNGSVVKPQRRSSPRPAVEEVGVALLF